MYAFRTLSAPEKLARREALDAYARLALASVLVPLLGVALRVLGGRVLRWVRQRSGAASGREGPRAPGSPEAKQRGRRRRWWRGDGGGTEGGVAARWRGVGWWFGEPWSVGGWGLGRSRKGEVLGAAVWMGWLVCLCFVGTGNDYLHLTKRFGIIGASQLPLHYLLSLKTPYSPLQILTGRSHESLLALHQLLGRIITALFFAHAALYLNFFIQSGLLAEKLSQFYILCGVFAALAFAVLGTTALKPLRDRSYRVFYATHVGLAAALLPALYFHVAHVRPYVWAALAVYAGGAAARRLATRVSTATIRPLPGAEDLVEIAVANRGAAAGAWKPGQHAYVSLGGHPLLRTLRSNPFSLASVPLVDGNARFVARVLDGNTVKLAQQAGVKRELAVEGPYGLATHADSLLRYDRVLFVAGGVGGTFIVPLYRQLLADLSPSKGSRRRQKVSFVWIARSMASVAWALPEDVSEKEGFVERLKVFLTRDVDGFASNADQEDFAGRVDEEDGGDGKDGIEMEEQNKLLSDAAAAEDGSADKHSSALAVQAGRPNLGRLVQQTFAHGSTERVAVMVCGPHSLSQSLRNEVGRFVKRGRDVWFWEESFGV